MSTRADIIDLLDNATEDMLEKILKAAEEIVRAGKGDKVYTLEEIRAKAVPIAKKYGVKKLSLFGATHAARLMHKATWIFFTTAEKERLNRFSTTWTLFMIWKENSVVTSTL